MRRFSMFAAAIALATAVTLGATPARGQGVADAVTASLVDRFEVVSGNILTAAERIPEEHYGFAPTEDVRTVAEQFNHVAAANIAYCGGVHGSFPPGLSRSEASSKAAIVERLRNSREFCLGVYRDTRGDDLAGTVTAPGGANTRVAVLIQNVAHDNLHYGNIVTYMRLLGLVPPSSD
jgi:uncharacterized damage-inducible protein DinB